MNSDFIVDCQVLAVATGKMVDVSLEDVHMARIQTRDRRRKTEPLAEVMRYCCKISEKLDTLIDIVEDDFASASSVRVCNYSTSEDGRRYFVRRDRGHLKSLSDIKNKKEHSMCLVHKNSMCLIHKKFGNSMDMLPT